MNDEWSNKTGVRSLESEVRRKVRFQDSDGVNRTPEIGESEVRSAPKKDGGSRGDSKAQGNYPSGISHFWPRASLMTTRFPWSSERNCWFAFSNSIP
jgi:hypothetical protein